MERKQRVNRCFPLLIILSLVVACGPAIDREKFQPLSNAGSALQASINEAGGPATPDLLATFQAEVVSLEKRIATREEAAALAKYREAGDACQFLLRLRFLENQTGDGPILLAGDDLAAALHYGLPVGGGDTSADLGRFAYVEPGSALQGIFSAAIRLLAEAEGALPSNH